MRSNVEHIKISTPLLKINYPSLIVKIANYVSKAIIICCVIITLSAHI